MEDTKGDVENIDRVSSRQEGIQLIRTDMGEKIDCRWVVDECAKCI
jgi:hypothetical protein